MDTQISLEQGAVGHGCYERREQEEQRWSVIKHSLMAMQSSYIVLKVYLQINLMQQIIRQ